MLIFTVSFINIATNSNRGESITSWSGIGNSDTITRFLKKYEKVQISILSSIHIRLISIIIVVGMLL